MSESDVYEGDDAANIGFSRWMGWWVGCTLPHITFFNSINHSKEIQN